MTQLHVLVQVEEAYKSASSVLAAGSALPAYSSAAEKLSLSPGPGPINAVRGLGGACAPEYFAGFR